MVQPRGSGFPDRFQRFRRIGLSEGAHCLDSGRPNPAPPGWECAFRFTGSERRAREFYLLVDDDANCRRADADLVSFVQRQFGGARGVGILGGFVARPLADLLAVDVGDRKSTRLNSSHLGISYAVFCLKRKKDKKKTRDSMKIIIIEIAYLPLRVIIRTKIRNGIIHYIVNTEHSNKECHDNST